MLGLLINKTLKYCLLSSSPSPAQLTLLFYGSAQPVIKNEKSEYPKKNLSTKIKTLEGAWFGPGKTGKQKVDGVSWWPRVENWPDLVRIYSFSGL